jgi:hypothetical protein
MRRLLFLLGAMLLVACSSGSPSTVIVPERLHNPGLLVVPRAQLDVPPDYALVADSGPIDAERYADESLDPDDTAAAVLDAGYVRGYDLVFEPSSPTVFQTQSGQLLVGTAAFEWVDDERAEDELVKIATDLQDFIGDESDGVRLVAASPFSPSAEVDSAIGYRTEWEIEGANPIYQTLAYGRFGKMIGAAVVMTFDPADVSTRVGAMLQQVVARSDLESHESPDVDAIREYLITVHERTLEMAPLVSDFSDQFSAAQLLDDPVAAAAEVEQAYAEFTVAIEPFLEATRRFTVPPEAAHAHDLDIRGMELAIELDTSAPLEQQLSNIQGFIRLSSAASEEFGRLTAVVLADEDDPLAVYLSQIWVERREVALANQRYADAIEGFTSSPSNSGVDDVIDAVAALIDDLDASLARWEAIVAPTRAAALHQRSLTLQRTVNDAMHDLSDALASDDIEGLLAANTRIFETLSEAGEIGTSWAELELEVLRATRPEAS